jgi:hypothetical protein
MSMFHPSTERLIDYWRSRAAHGRMPERTAVDPTDFAPLLPQVFIAGRVASGIYPIRLAGGFVADLHGQDLRQQNLLSLFRERDRFNLQSALEAARRRPEPIVATVAVVAESATIDMEVLFSPLAGSGDSMDRFLGLYQPLRMVSRLLGQRAQTLAIASIRSTGAANEETPRLKLATLDGRRIA